MRQRIIHIISCTLACISFALITLYCGAARAQDIYYSLQGDFTEGGDQQRLFFDVASAHIPRIAAV